MKKSLHWSSQEIDARRAGTISIELHKWKTFQMAKCVHVSGTTWHNSHAFRWIILFEFSVIIGGMRLSLLSSYSSSWRAFPKQFSFGCFKSPQKHLAFCTRSLVRYVPFFCSCFKWFDKLFKLLILLWWWRPRQQLWCCVVWWWWCLLTGTLLVTTTTTLDALLNTEHCFVKKKN